MARRGREGDAEECSGARRGMELVWKATNKVTDVFCGTAIGILLLCGLECIGCSYLCRKARRKGW